MAPTDALNHLLNFAAPAMGLAVLMALASWVLERKRPAAFPAMARLVANFLVGLGVLAIGLWCFGRDGMMATYAALVLVMATSQWVMLRGWRAAPAATPRP